MGQQASFTNQQMRMQMHVHNDAMAMASVPRTIAMNAPQQAWNNSNVDLFANPTNQSNVNGFSNANTVSSSSSSLMPPSPCSTSSFLPSSAMPMFGNHAPFGVANSGMDILHNQQSNNQNNVVNGNGYFDPSFGVNFQ